MQDGATLHSSLIVREWLQERFQWIGRGSPHHWPAQSPDFVSNDMFLCGDRQKTILQEEA